MDGSTLYDVAWECLDDSNFGQGLNKDGILDFAAYVFDLEYEALLDVSTMLNVTHTAFKSLSKQIVRSFVSKPSNDTVRGTIIQSENWIFIHTASMWVMTSVFAVLVVLILVITFKRPSGVVPCNVDTIMGHALIRGRSRDMEGLLIDTGSSNAERFESAAGRAAADALHRYPQRATHRSRFGRRSSDDRRKRQRGH